MVRATMIDNVDAKTDVNSFVSPIENEVTTIVVVETDVVVTVLVDVDAKMSVVYCVFVAFVEGINAVVEDDISTVGNVDTDTQTDHFIFEQNTDVPPTGLSNSTFIYNFVLK